MSERYNRGADGTNPMDHSFNPGPNGVVERLGGDELQARTMTHYTPDDGVRRSFGMFPPGYFWANIERLLAECDAIMAKDGWHRTEEKPGLFPGDRDVEPYSDLWYAGNIGANCWMVLENRKQGRMPEVDLTRIFNIAARVTEWDWRGKYKSHIVRGKGTLKAARSGGEGRRGKFEADTMERLSKMEWHIMQRPGMGIRWAAEQTFKNGLGASAVANRKLWYRHKQGNRVWDLT